MGLFDWMHWAFTPIRAVMQWLVPYQPPSILGRGVYKVLQGSVFFLTENNLPDGKPVGVGFCVGNKNKAITAWQNLPANARVGDCVVGFPGSQDTRNSLDLEVAYVSPQLNLAVLEIKHSTFTHQSLQIHTTTPMPGTECMLASFQFSLTELFPDETSHSVGIFRGIVVKLHPHHLCYDCPSFSGDSGGAVILSNGGIIGMHIETVNQARERLRQASVGSNKLHDIDQSVESLIRSISSGSIGLNASFFAHMVVSILLFLCYTIPS